MLQTQRISQQLRICSLIVALLIATFHIQAKERSTETSKTLSKIDHSPSTHFPLNSRTASAINLDTFNEVLREAVLDPLNGDSTTKNNVAPLRLNSKLVESEGIIDSHLRVFANTLSINKGGASSSQSDSAASTTNQLMIQSAHSQSQANFSFIGNQQNYVLRYVCCSDLPIISDPTVPSNQLFSASNIVAVPESNEVVAVFDDLPIYNGNQLFVRVQRSGGQHYWGWFPLFWLHNVSSPKVGANIHTGVSYQGISKQIRDTVEDIFYQNCHAMHPEGGEPNFPSAPPADKNYQCGEYPVGNTAYQYTVDNKPFRHLANVRKVINSYTSEPLDSPLQHLAFGYRGTGIGNNAIVLDIPFRIGALSTQTRRDSNFNAQELAADDFQFLTRSYWQSEVAQEDENVRVHAMDWYFKTWFDSDAPASAHEINFSLRVNLPGFDIYTPMFDGDILVWYRDHNGALSQAHISQLEFGGMRMQDVPLRIDGKVMLNINDTGSIQQTFVTNTKNQVSVQFTNIEATTEPEITFYDEVNLIYQSQGNTEYINYGVNYFRSMLNATLSNDGFGSYFWEVASETVMSSLMDALQALEPRLVQLFDSPRSLAVEACDNAMPNNYKNMQSPFYAFYRNCLDFAATISSQHFVNPTNQSINIPYGFSENPSYWANVNLAGLLWYAPDHQQQDWPCAGDASCTTVIDRPWWSLYNPYYTHTGGPKFNPSSYSYVSSKGGKVRYQAYGEVTKHYWHFLRCLIPSADQKLNADPQNFLSNIAAITPEQCRLSALETVCELYGEGQDLEAQWDARWGYVPPLSGYTQYCAWAEELRNQEEDDSYGLQIE